MKGTMTSKLLLLFVVGLTAFMPIITGAGEIRGTLTEGGQPHPAATVTVKVGNKKYSSTTDKNGYYRVFVSEPGQCTVTVVVDSQDPAPSATVSSFDRSIQYDLILDGVPENHTLRVR